MPTSVNFYQQFWGNVANGNINLASDEIKVMLVDGYTFNAAHDELLDVSAYEIIQDNGYDTGGLPVSNIAIGYVGGLGLTRWDFDDPVWNASGGDIGPTTGAVIYSDTSPNKKIICYLDFDDNITISDGTDFRLVLGSEGVFTV